MGPGTKFGSKRVGTQESLADAENKRESHLQQFATKGEGNPSLGCPSIWLGVHICFQDDVATTQDTFIPKFLETGSRVPTLRNSTKNFVLPPKSEFLLHENVQTS